MLAHTPVLLYEAIKFLDPGPGKKFIDATVGRGGHAAELLKSGAEVLGIDRDPDVIPSASGQALRNEEGSHEILRDYAQNNNLKVVVENFGEIAKIGEANGFSEVDGILFDLGLGSHQLDDPQRGFSFQKDGPLDMRYDQKPEIRSQKSETAADILNFYPEKDLIRIFFQYGEEKRFGKKIARAILAYRKHNYLKTTGELFDLIKQALPGKFRFRAGDTARKIFQALRIEVNRELVNLERGLQQALPLLKSGGKLVVISFHSLEDRIVKNFFVRQSRDCVCPPSFPVCRCDARASLRILTKKPAVASVQEIADNPRSKSAKLRAAEKI